MFPTNTLSLARFFRGMVRPLGDGMIILGSLIIVVTIALYGYGQYENYLFEHGGRQALEKKLMSEPVTPVVLTPVTSPTAIPSAIAVPAAVVPSVRPQSPLAAVPPTATAVPTATPIPILPARRIVAPAIKLDSPILEEPFKNGEWQVPKFVAGHLVGTAEPLEGGNIVLAGHIQSISSGNVFANISKLRPGNKIEIMTQAETVTYVVQKVFDVSNTDAKIIQPTAHEQLTLLTCDGPWMPLAHDYALRLIVVATPAS